MLALLGNRSKPSPMRNGQRGALAQGLEIATLFPEGPAQWTRNIVRGETGTLNGGIARHSLWGGGPNLDGSDDYVRFGLPARLSVSAPVTISMIAKFDGTPALKNCFNVATGTDSVMIGYWWNSGNGFLLDVYPHGVGTNGTQLSRNPDITQYHHWHWTWNGNATTGKIWVDAVDLSAAQSASLSSVANNGVDIGRGASTFNGDMSLTGFWVWSRVLLPSEIRQHVEQPWWLWEDEDDQGWGRGPAGRTPKNTRAFPLGTFRGMNRRVTPGML